MSELLERIHGEIRERLAASAAAVREYERLEAALAALDGVAAPAPRPSTAQPSRASRKRPTRSAPAKRAPRGANREAALRAIGERPGICVADLILATGINRAVLYALLGRLVEQGAVVGQALPGEPAGYALQPTPVAPDEPTTARADAPAGPSVVSDDVAPPSEAVIGEDERPKTETEAGALTPVRDTPRARRRAKAKAAAAPSPGAAAEVSASESGADQDVQTGSGASAVAPPATPARRNVPRPRRLKRKPAPQGASSPDSAPTEIVAAESAQSDVADPASAQPVSEPQKAPRSPRRARPKPNVAD
jgi:hypothetical protein